MAARPKVSIVTIAYNQGKYIQQAMDSFIAQQTDFEFEVIVADDGSADKTPRIIETYAAEHPHIFKPILRKKNIGAQKNFIDALQTAKGEYIALCEGDDYWTDPRKLQSQVDFLEKHRQYSFCFHPVRVFFENDEEPAKSYPDPGKKSKFTVEDLLEQNFIYTNSVVYRKQSYKDMPDDILPLDWYLHLYHAQFGKIGFISKTMSAYRRHAGGIWWDAYKDMDHIWIKHGIPHVTLFIELLKLYSQPKYRPIIENHIDELLNTFVRIDGQYKTRLLGEAMRKFPDQVERFMGEQYRSIAGKDRLISDLQDSLRQKDDEIQKANYDIALMKASRLWKARTMLKRLIKRNRHE